MSVVSIEKVKILPAQNARFSQDDILIQEKLEDTEATLKVKCLCPQNAWSKKTRAAFFKTACLTTL